VFTAPNVAVLTIDTVCDVTAIPANQVPEGPSVTLDPVMGVQVIPSLEVEAV
jgi:hypothetical protein